MPEQVQGVQEEVQLREQDFGNFQVGGWVGGWVGEGLLNSPAAAPCTCWVGTGLRCNVHVRRGCRHHCDACHWSTHPPACLPGCLVCHPPPLQDAEGKKREKAERLRFGRFFYRFPNGESGADVYDRCAAVAAVFAGLRC